MPKVKVKGNRLMEIRGGFVALTNRRLPIAKEMKIALMFGKLRSVIDVYLEKLKQIQVEQSECEALEEGSEERRIKQAEIDKRLNDLGECEYEIVVPREKLTEADLPTVIKSKDGSGESNATGRAAIAVTLWPEFFELKDEEASVPPASDDEDDGQS